MATRLHIFCTSFVRGLAVLALLLQLGLPMAQAQAAANGTDLSALICNPSGRTISVEAKAALTVLLAAVGGDLREDDQTERPSECERCVAASAAITAPDFSGVPPAAYTRCRSAYPGSETLGPITARGPPCGSRAPPFFV